jgi:hypothetical protein
MASLPCQNEDGKIAVFTGTFLESGTSVTVCRDDLQAFAVALAQELTGAPIIEFAQEHAGEITPNETVEEVDEVDAETAAWLEEHSDIIAALVAGGKTPEEAIQELLDAETAPDNSDAAPSTDDN